MRGSIAHDWSPAMRTCAASLMRPQSGWLQWPGDPTPDQEADLRPSMAILLGAALSACRAEPPTVAPSPAMRPIDAHLDRVDGALVPRFGARRPPRVRVDTSSDLAARLVVVRGPLAVGLSTTARAAPEARFLEGAPPVGLPAGPARLQVRAGQRVLDQWTITWDPAGMPPRLAPVDAARRAGALERAERLLGELSGPTPAEQAWLALEQGLIALRRSQLAEAIERFGAAAEQAEAAGRLTDAGRARRLAAFTAYRLGRMRDALHQLDAASRLADEAGDVAGAASVYHYRAEVERARGDLRAAERAARATVAHAESIGQARLAGYGQTMLAVMRQQQGHHAEARALIEALADRMPEMPADLRGTWHGNRGWILMEGRQQGAFEVPLTEIVAAFRAALEAMADRPDEQANQYANLAAVAWLAEDRAALDEALTAYAELDPQRQLHEGLFVMVLEGWCLLADDRADAALAQFRAIERRAMDDAGEVTSTYVWRARLGQARAHRLAGRSGAALAAYEQSIEALERAAARTGLQESRAAFFADHRGLLDEAFLAARNAERIDAAFAIADAARARVMRDLDGRLRPQRLDDAERAEWTRRLETYLARRRAFESGRSEAAMLTDAERAEWRRRRQVERAALQQAFDDAFDWLDRAAPLPPSGATVAAVQAALAPDEGVLLVHPAIDGTRYTFWVTAAALVEVSGPARPGLTGVAHVYLIDPTPSAGQTVAALLPEVSVSRLTHAGQLIEPRPAARSTAALVIGDPDGTLPHARAEARRVESALPAARLMLGAQATHAAVREALPEAAVVHFAGHGVLDGRSPWDAHLKLADDARLSLEDLLLLRPTARLVVLSGCETGRTAELSQAAIRLGLAPGLLAAGVGAVIAADRPVDDAATARFMERLYAAGAATQPADALRTAALARRADGDEHWHAFHLWGRR